jgi:hypothetical protein
MGKWVSNHTRVSNQEGQDLSTSTQDTNDEQHLDIDRSLKTFTLFPILPAEIRVHIWWLASLEGRLIWEPPILSLLGEHDEEEDESYDNERNTFRIPLIAHVCHESRSEALKIYSRYFETPAPERQQSWWNPARDTLIFHWSFMLPVSSGFRQPSDLLQPILAQTKHLALLVGDNANLLSKLAKPLERNYLFSFTALETLELVLDPEDLADELDQIYEVDRFLISPYLPVFHEPLDVPVDVFNRTRCVNKLQEISKSVPKPSEVEHWLNQKLKKDRESLDPKKTWNVPLVKVVVLGVEKFRRSKWYLPLGSDSRAARFRPPSPNPSSEES